MDFQKHLCIRNNGNYGSNENNEKRGARMSFKKGTIFGSNKVSELVFSFLILFTFAAYSQQTRLVSQNAISRTGITPQRAVSVNTLQNLIKAKQLKQFKGFVAVNNRQIYVDFIYPTGNSPILVLFNGVTNYLSDYDSLTEVLISKGYGVFRFDPMGMGETLKKYGAPKSVIDYKDQISDARGLLTQFRVPKPYNLVGLSYGGGLSIAFAEMFPNEVANVVAMSPYTEPIVSQDAWVNTQVVASKFWPQFLGWSDEQRYDFFYKQLVYTTYPLAEPRIKQIPGNLESVYQLAKGIRPFYASKLAKQLPIKSMHLMIAELDQLIPTYVHRGFWNSVPKTDKASVIVVKGSYHKMNEQFPVFVGAWIHAIMLGTPMLKEGQEFYGVPKNMTIISTKGTFALKP